MMMGRCSFFAISTSRRHHGLESKRRTGARGAWRLTMAERKALTAAIRSRDQRGQRRRKGKILAEFIALTSYHRVYARSVLRTGEQKLVREQPTPAESK